MVVGERQKSNHLEEVRPSRTRPYLPLAILTIGVVLSVAAYFSVRHWEEAMVHFDFEMLSASHAATIDNELARNLAALDALSGLYTVSRHVERQQFDRFAANISARHGDIQALVWAPRVNATQRAALIRQAEREGLTNFRIQRLNGDDAAKPETSQADAFPIFYVHPMDKNERLVGVDLISEPVYRSLLATACDSGRVAVSPPVQTNLNIGDSIGNGVLLAHAVYQEGANLQTIAGRRAGLEGFVLQLFRIGDLVEEALRESAVLGLDIRVAYKRNPVDPQRNNFHSLGSRLFDRISFPLRDFTDFPGTLQLRTPLGDFGKSWALIFTPGAKFWSHHPMWTSWAVLAAGLLLSLLSAVVVWWSPWRSEQARTRAASLPHQH